MAKTLVFIPIAGIYLAFIALLIYNFFGKEIYWLFFSSSTGSSFCWLLFDVFYIVSEHLLWLNISFDQ